MEVDIYKNYTSTSVLSGVDVDKFTKWSHQYFKACILPHFPKDKTCNILEIGCGYGRYTGLIYNELGYKNIYGIDISEEQIEYAKNVFKLENVAQADAIDFLANQNQKYDVILLMDVMEHLELNYAIQLTQKVQEVLNHGGVFIIQVPNGLSPMKPIFQNDITHVRAFTPNSISQLLRMGGFEKFHHYPLKPFVHSFKSFIHKLIWTVFLYPPIYLFFKLYYGNTFGGIYTANLLTIAIK
jgi:2-polyprenyl-3-methyl-5-hydroxy-6-metoxy-1,4-benzoquinol methylase